MPLEHDITAGRSVLHGERFVKLTDRWRRAPLVARLGIHIVTVGVDGTVRGLDL